MLFGASNLQNQVFCLTEERDFFQTKYLEQVSEISSLKEELLLVRREVSRLRGLVMSSENSSHVIMTTPSPKSNIQYGSEDSDGSSTGTEECSKSTLTENSSDHDRTGESTDDEGAEEEKDIRQSAEKLLQWASYRSSAYRSKSIEDTFTHCSSPKTANEHDSSRM
jgi:hypothetical protein